MASLPKSDPSPRFLTAEELLEIRGTPEFYAEYRRQMLAIAEHGRRNGNADWMEVDWASIKGWE
jgi:hypothetical protein